MNKNQTEHINNLVSEDETDCIRQIKILLESNYSEDAKNILVGFFRQRSELNQKILTENNYFE